MQYNLTTKSSVPFCINLFLTERVSTTTKKKGVKTNKKSKNEMKTKQYKVSITHSAIKD